MLNKQIENTRSQRMKWYYFFWPKDEMILLTLHKLDTRTQSHIFENQCVHGSNKDTKIDFNKKKTQKRFPFLFIIKNIQNNYHVVL